MKMVGAYQGLWSWNQLSPWKSEFGSRRLESKDSFESIGSGDYDVQVVQRDWQAQYEDCSQYGSHEDGSRFYSTLGYMERSTGRWEDPGDKAQYKKKKSPEFKKDDKGVLWYKGRICVPNIKKLKDKILQEAHNFAFSIHPRGNKMYHDLKATN
jgi:hypothetical protein